jgi:hypothetical protein
MAIVERPLGSGFVIIPLALVIIPLAHLLR